MSLVRPLRRLFLYSVAGGRLASVNFRHGLLQVVVILIAKLVDAIFPIEALADHLVSLHELVDFACEFIILVADDADVVIHRVDLHLEVGVVFEEGAIGVAGTFKLLAHVEELILLLSDFHL